MEENNIETEVPTNNPENQPVAPKQNQTQVAGAILIVGILIAGAIMLRGSTPPPNTNTGANNPTPAPMAMNGRPVSSADHITGNPNGKIVIIEYSDLECPFCKVFHATMHKVIESNKNVAWVYRHYPIPQLHAKATREAEATECAWEQGGNDAFWKYTDRVFEVTGSNDRLDSSELPKIAEFIGLNVASFNACLESGKYAGKVQADVEDGIKMGVNGTPSSFVIVNGKVVSFILKDGSVHDSIPGAQPYDIIIQNLNRISK